MMDRFFTEERIFHVARAIAEEHLRNEYLDQVCGGDVELRKRVEELLKTHESEQSFLRSNGDFKQTVDCSPVTEQEGQQIGRYKLLQRIGEGGFGVVFMAQQYQPMRRKVALKIIKPGMDTREVVARFEAERQALALMDHSNIAKVLDGGTTESGRPFFVMELVKGKPITEYCDENQLATEERLQLFQVVCQAVQHAHQKGIIHRDLKPSNVLVTLADGKPVVKVIDFGVAKATNQQLTEKTLFTAFGQMMGTPQYMSPEQAEISCLDVDTRSDVYSLGVLLYELLTGTTPLESERLRHAGYAEMQRLIREEEPPKPSTRLTTSSGEQLTAIAKHRSIAPERLHREIRGDLDWIVMKSLEKDRNRRFESPNAFSQDVARYLQNEPVESRPPTVRYRAAKYLRRNKFPLSFGLMAVTLLSLGLIGMTWQWNFAQRTLKLLVKSQLEDAVIEALCGNNERTVEIIDRLDETANIADGDRSLIQAINLMFDRDYAQAIKLTEKAKNSESDLLGKERVGAEALAAMVSFWSGNIEEVEPKIAKLRDAIPETDVDKLLWAYAMVGNYPYEAKRQLKEISGSIRQTPAWLLVYGQCETMIAGDSRDHKRFEIAIGYLSAAQLLLKDSNLADYWYLNTGCAAIELAQQDERSVDEQRLLARFRDFANANYEGGNGPGIHSRWWYQTLSGNLEKADQLCLGATHERVQFFVAAESMHQELDPELALDKFNRLTRKQEITDWYRLAKAHVVVGTKNDREEIRELVSELVDHEAPIIRRHALAVLSLVSTPEELQEFADLACEKCDQASIKDPDLWLGEHLVRYFKEKNDLDHLAGKHEYSISNVEFSRGMVHLANGEVDEAKRAFERASKGGLGSMDQGLAKAYLTRWKFYEKKVQQTDASSGIKCYADAAVQSDLLPKSS